MWRRLSGTVHFGVGCDSSGAEQQFSHLLCVPFKWASSLFQAGILVPACSHQCAGKLPTILRGCRSFLLIFAFVTMSQTFSACLSGYGQCLACRTAKWYVPFEAGIPLLAAYSALADFQGHCGSALEKAPSHEAALEVTNTFIQQNTSPLATSLASTFAALQTPAMKCAFLSSAHCACG